MFADINECASEPCQNGGACIDEIDGFTCECCSGYTDTLCETGIVTIMLKSFLFYDWMVYRHLNASNLHKVYSKHLLSVLVLN